MIAPLVFTLNDGRRVLGKLYKGEPSPVTFANRTQARKRYEALRAEGVACSLPYGYHAPFYVVIEEARS
jgi:hypothetical protein